MHLCLRWRNSLHFPRQDSVRTLPIRCSVLSALICTTTSLQRVIMKQISLHWLQRILSLKIFFVPVPFQLLRKHARVPQTAHEHIICRRCCLSSQVISSRYIRRELSAARAIHDRISRSRKRHKVSSMTFTRTICVISILCSRQNKILIIVRCSACSSFSKNSMVTQKNLSNNLFSW